MRWAYIGPENMIANKNCNWTSISDPKNYCSKCDGYRLRGAWANGICPFTISEGTNLNNCHLDNGIVVPKIEYKDLFILVPEWMSTEEVRKRMGLKEIG